MKIIKVCLLLSLCIILFSGCKEDNHKIGDLEITNLGKNLTITVSENETVDSEYLQNVLDGKIKKDVPYFDLWDSSELAKMIDYMDKNNLALVEGVYTFNQTWTFEDGLLVSNDNEKHEIFNFKQIYESYEVEFGFYGVNGWEGSPQTITVKKREISGEEITEEEAIAIADEVLLSVTNEEYVNTRISKVVEKDDIYVVSKRSEGWVAGGTLDLEIRKSDGKVLRVISGGE